MTYQTIFIILIVLILNVGITIAEQTIECIIAIPDYSPEGAGDVIFDELFIGGKPPENFKGFGGFFNVTACFSYCYIGYENITNQRTNNSVSMGETRKVANAPKF